MSMTSLVFIKLCKKSDNERDQNLRTPEDIIRYDNIEYGPDKKWNLLDVYLPKEQDGLLPVIVNVHGGGFVYGTKDTYQYYGMSLAQQGFGVVNFSYHLAPKKKFPTPMAELTLVMEWIMENAKTFKLDTDRIFMVGDSAGAHILSLFCCLCSNSEFAKQVSVFPKKEYMPKAIALNCGLYEMKTAMDENKKSFPALMKDYLGWNHLDKLPLLDVMSKMNRDFPPTFLMTAEYDFLKTQAPFMERRLQELEIPHRYKIFESKNTKLEHVFQCNIKLEEAKSCNLEQCDFFKEI